MYVSIFIYIYGMIYWVFYMIRIRLKSTLRGNADMFSQQMRSLLTVICSLVLSVSILEGAVLSVSLAPACIYVYIWSIHIAAVVLRGGSRGIYGNYNIMETALTVDRLFLA